MFLCEPEDNVWERRMGLVLGFSLEVTFHRFFLMLGRKGLYIACFFFGVFAKLGYLFQLIWSMTKK